MFSAGNMEDMIEDRDMQPLEFGKQARDSHVVALRGVCLVLCLVPVRLKAFSGVFLLALNALLAFLYTPFLRPFHGGLLPSRFDTTSS